MCKVLQVKKFPIYDVFLGDGWKEWSRVKFVNGNITVIEGAPLNSSVVNSVNKAIKEYRTAK